MGPIGFLIACAQTKVQYDNCQAQPVRGDQDDANEDQHSAVSQVRVHGQYLLLTCRDAPGAERQPLGAMCRHEEP